MNGRKAYYYGGIKFLSNTFKIWERVINSWLRESVSPDEIHFAFMQQNGTIDATSILIANQREGQGNISVGFVDLDNAYDRVPREELWRALRVRGVPE